MGPNVFSASGGTAIFVKNNIPHHEFIPPPFQQIEATLVVLDINKNDPVTLTSIYIPPKADNYLALFDIENLIQISPNQIICGDFNAKHTAWGCLTNCTRGNVLQAFANNAGVEILAPSTPTRFGYTSANTLDLIMVRDFLSPYDILSVPDLSSDHNPVIANFYFKFTLPRLIGKTKTNWNLFKNKLESINLINSMDINTPEMLENIVERFEEDILAAKIAASNPIPQNQNYIDPRIRNIRKERNLARKTFQTTRDPALKRITNKLNKEIIKLSDKLEDENYTNKLVNANTQDGSFWNLTGSFKKKKQDIPTLNGPASIANTDTEKANCLAESLEKQLHLNDISHTETETIVQNSVEGFLNTYRNSIFQIDPPSNCEIFNCIKNLNIHKAPGIDGINNKMIKNLPSNIISNLTTIIHLILSLGHFPSRWKTATVIPILKPGKDPTNPESYRPISLLPSISKIVEHIILNRFNSFLANNSILCPEQFGFRKNLSTSHQLLRVVEFIEEGFINKQKTGAVFLDIQKAFDRVWQDALIHKLINYNTPPYITKTFLSYMKNRKFAVKVKSSLSETKNIHAGVAQGSKIGPTLFSIFINDIPKQFNTMISLYADDTAILARNKNPNYIQLALNRHLLSLEDWFAKWKIAINATKSEAIMFTKSTQKTNYPPVKINNKIIPWSQECKYLGVILDTRLTWKPHFLYTKKKFRDLTRKFYPLISRNAKLSRENKILIYTAYLRPVLTYASSVWGYAAKYNHKIIETQQNLLIRKICGANIWYIHNTDIYKALDYPPSLSSSKNLLQTSTKLSTITKTRQLNPSLFINPT
ncbi:RNA-directed DNA polymerase from mobile element jockey [Araneus ventricosus]|uniref:RNA-directed DNA polymerase from mobile element jockey n=1 Tax=Araneus ventricosus TaxID=182803 RepID=A0A4Y2JFT8_ARAVE|nr:RNA-directed DNA polymerase from mobile element jockey [Araneus ventricosus]